MEVVSRAELVSRLVRCIGDTAVGVAHPFRVAVDGPDAAGKSTLADDLAASLSTRHPVIRLGIDDFHRPREERLRRGDLDPDGYYEDSFDLEVVVEDVLRPLGPGGDRRYLPSAYDHRLDRPTSTQRRTAPPDAVVVFDGVFLQRPELRDHWDLCVYLHVEPEEALRRALARDVGLLGSEQQMRERYVARYLPGQLRYREETGPTDRCDVLVDLTDPELPVVKRWRGRPSP